MNCMKYVCGDKEANEVINNININHQEEIQHKKYQFCD